ncbi:NAD-dependent epimerase/dehydratase family protein [Microbacterium sp. NPDC058389]|uniref:NAD-dependent epimerase/dehydratase family protein n=1 Tax=Microbacterium sp. NPDC058389 TaxID=3346475 RepID=UPI003664DC7C
MTRKVLFLGGAGMIGTAAGKELVASGAELTIVTRNEPARPPARGVRSLRADVRDAASLDAALGGEEFDAVVNWVGFSAADVSGDIARFAGRTGQYVFISTCSVYSRPAALPLTESSPRRAPKFGYPQGKIAAEVALEQGFRDRGLPLTIVRPMHTYDDTTMIFPASWTTVERMRQGLPVVVHGDGTSLWTLTHVDDFARGFAPLVGNRHAVGEIVNLVSGDILTWDEIYLTLADAAGVRDPHLVHRSSESIGKVLPGWAEVLQEDFRHSILFETTKLQRLVPGFAPRISFSEGARRIVDWHDADASRRTLDRALVEAYEKLIAS